MPNPIISDTDLHELVGQRLRLALNLLNDANATAPQAQLVPEFSRFVDYLTSWDPVEVSGLRPALRDSIEKLQSIGRALQRDITTSRSAGMTMTVALWQELIFLAAAFDVGRRPTEPSDISAAAVMARIGQQHHGWIGVALSLNGARYEGEPDIAVRNQFIALKNASMAPVRPVDPLVLDLDGDGISTVGRDQKIYFDSRGDGIRNVTGWVGPRDGILVLDRNGNGTIDNGTELFGDGYVLRNGSRARDGLAALAEHDSNGDGVIDARDATWSSIKVWRDVNQDGIAQADELHLLSQLGIASLSLKRTANDRTLSNGNHIGDTASFTYVDGKKGSMGNVNFVQDPFMRSFTDPVAVSAAIRELPGMRGSGRVRDLHEATALSETLRDALESYPLQGSATEQATILGAVLSAWADTSDMVKTMQERFAGKFTVMWESLGGKALGSDIQSQALLRELERKIHVIEAFNGQYFYVAQTGNMTGFTVVAGKEGQPGAIKINLTTQQLALIERNYQVLMTSVQSSLAMQARLPSLLSQMRIVMENSGPRVDFTGVLQALPQLQQIDFLRAVQHLLRRLGASEQAMFAQAFSRLPVDTLEMINMNVMPTSAVNVIYGTAGADTLTGGSGNDDIFGNEGNDVIDGGAGDDRLFGGDGDDIIFGGDGNDKIYGGAGNDILDGGRGDDLIEGGDGDDIITDSDGRNILRGGDGNDRITGTGTFEGGRGDDILIAGQAYSDDLYLFNLGDGRDTITERGNAYYGWSTKDELRFGEGIHAASVQVIRDGQDLIFKISESDQVRVKYWYSSKDYHIETISFADGTRWTSSQIQAGEILVLGTVGNDEIRVSGGHFVIQGGAGNDKLYGGEGNDRIYGGDGDDTIHGGDGNDKIYGGAGNDILDGGRGDDLIEGGDGDDTITDSDGRNILRGGDGNDRITGTGTFEGGRGDDILIAGQAYSDDLYLFNLGDGRDTVMENGNIYYGWSTKDELRFGQGIAQDQLWFKKVGEDLDITLIGSNDGVLIKNWYRSVDYRIETIRLFDGKILTDQRVDTLVQAMASLTPPAAGQTSLSPDQAAQLRPVLAAGWR